jgi:SHS2 domain-containing protein
MMGTCQPSAISFQKPTAPVTRLLKAHGWLMEPFRVLEHTADIGFEAFGRTRQEVFANAARALVNIVVDLPSITARQEVRIEVEASDPPSLLVNWLSEILYLSDAEGWLFSDFEMRSLTDRSLSALARGEKFDPTRHQTKLLVKAITYHQLALEKTLEGWRAQVYVDI